MHILVLGAAAGGGFPQWNSHSEACRRVRAKDPAAVAQTQSSVAISADGERWFLMNASPDLRQQIEDNPQLHPNRGERHSPIAGVVLTNADVDHIAGLLNLREREAFALYATERVLGVLAGNSVFNVLNPEFVSRTAFRLNETLILREQDGRDSGLRLDPFAVPGKVALFLEDESKGPNFGSVDEDTIGLKVTAEGSDKSFFYIPGCARVPADLMQRLQGADLLFFDGTLWQDDEMVQQGAGPKTGQRMGHISMNGSDGTIAIFNSADIGERYFIHINNTNPVLLRDSAERAAVDASGWKVAYDGMEIIL